MDISFDLDFSTGDAIVTGTHEGTGNFYTHNFGALLANNNNWSVLIVADSMGEQYAISEVTIITGAVPEPSTYALMAIGLIGLAVYRRKK